MIKQTSKAGRKPGHKVTDATRRKIAIKTKARNQSRNSKTGRFVTGPR